VSVQDCRYFDSCSAPICPLDGCPGAVWYPDEEICRAYKYHQGVLWVGNQRKIAKRAKGTDTCYTWAMLNRDIVVRKGIEGANPDARDFDAEVKRWIASHPERTPDQKAAAQHRGQNLQRQAKEGALA